MRITRSVRRTGLASSIGAPRKLGSTSRLPLALVVWDRDRSFDNSDW